jgi:carbonic anhydrase
MYLTTNTRIEAGIFRIGGGRVAPIITQIATLDCFIGGFKEIMIIHHTGSS